MAGMSADEKSRYGFRHRDTISRLERNSTQEPPSTHRASSILPYRPRRSDSYPAASLKEFRKTRLWPPRGYSADDTLNSREAEDLICAGASTFKGYSDEVKNVPPGHFRFYAVMEAEHCARTDRAPFQDNAFMDISFNATASAENAFPWLSLEQPCMAYCFGKRPGTTTLSFKTSKSGTLGPLLEYESTAKPRRIKLLTILDRLRHLETGIEEDDPAELYRYLYSKLIEDPDADTEPHFGLEQQMTDLIIVLTNSDWIDFSQPRNQIVAKYFDSPDESKKQKFFHQLLLSVELYLRVYSLHHEDKPKRCLLSQLPPIVQWDLALAQRWLENMSIQKTSISPKQTSFSFDLRSKNRQKEALRTFATTLKWPNLSEIDTVLQEDDPSEKELEERSADALSWFSAVVLPGATMPWLLMNTLIDCDSSTGDALRYLTHMHPAAGFQYRANTYWSYRCIVGKVLGAARGVKAIAGWIGPCNYSPDLKRTECAFIRQRAPPEQRLTIDDVGSMGSRTDPLGPRDASYPVDDYELVVPDTDDVTDAIRVQKLEFKPAKNQPNMSRLGEGAPLTFDAAIVFAWRGQSWPMRLRYDVDFVAAYPCHQGPHVLFYDYAYRAVKVDDDLVDLHGWGPCSPTSRSSSRPTSSHLSSQSPPSALSALTATETSSEHIIPANVALEKVLVIEALGVSDNEVFARAWCAHWGHSAIVANIKETCMACAIREAYAACISVVILTEGGRPGEDDAGVHG
ncbi:hypothetical protein H2201_004439 [Coniosporium apollinis]|uniref:Vtc domain-containing protein n=1 Tax=Coniosporium apollinis TaxID=61459 RepID=A0ABQ9NZ27_9PEZI|nr:hypothetical protein H2201_004439 [Coniosporium apollinis]